MKATVEPPPPNLRVLKPSRQALRPGDVFAMEPPDGRYLFGRVIYINLPIEMSPVTGANLVYIYATRSDSLDPPLADLTRDSLLIGPTFINRLPWSRGYFQTVLRGDLLPTDILETHCFYDYSLKRYVGLRRGTSLPGPIEPCGEYGLQSYRTIDDLISDALGIPLVPD